MYLLFCFQLFLNKQVGYQVEFKFMIAGFVFINLLWISIENAYKDKYLEFKNLLKLSSILQIIIIVITYLINSIHYGFKYPLNQYLKVLRFSRTEKAMYIRYDMMSKFSVGNLLKLDWTNTTWVGPLVVLIPLMYLTILIIEYNYKEKVKYNDLILYLTIVFSIYIINSRAMLLFIVVISITKYISLKLPKYFLKIIGYSSFVFPFILLIIPSKFDNGRKIQQQIVIENLNASGLKKVFELNKTYTFDNAHIEFVQYFGYIAYIIALFSLKNIYRKNINIY